MSKSSSSPVNKTSTATNAKETNVAATNTKGITLLGNKGTTVVNANTNTQNTNITTDAGAVQAGTALGALAISSNTGLSETLASDELSFGNHAIDVVSSSAAENASLVSNTLAWGGGVLSEAESNIAHVEETQSQQFGNITSTLANIAQQTGTSQASQQNDLLKYIVIAIAGVAAIYFLTRN